MTATTGDVEDKGRTTNLIEDTLFKGRDIMIFGEIDQEVARQTIARMLAMAHASNEPIRLFVSSPGGHVESGDAIHDMIKAIEPDVKMIGTGWVASAGALIYLGAKKENRVCLPNTRFLLHQPKGGAGGPATDIRIQANEIIKMRDRLNRIIANETGQPIERVAKDTDRDYWMTSDEAIEYGLVGRVINSLSEA